MEYESYTEWCFYERGVKDKVYPAGCVYVALSASSDRCIVLAEDTVLQDASRWAVFFPKHHPNLFAELFACYAWPLLYARTNQGINFNFENLKFLVFPKVDKSQLDVMEKQIILLNKVCEKEQAIIEQYKNMQLFFREKMFI